MLLTIKTRLYREGDSWTGEAVINTEKGPLKLIAREPMAPARNRAASVVGKLYLTDGQAIPVADPDFEIVGGMGKLRDEGLINDPEAFAVVLGCIGSMRADEALNNAEANDLPVELNYAFDGDAPESGDYSGRGLEIIGRSGGHRGGGGGGRRGHGGSRGRHHHHRRGGAGPLFVNSGFVDYGYPYLIEDEEEEAEIVGGRSQRQRRLGRVGVVGNPAEVGYWGDPLTPQVAALGDTRINDLAACAHGDISDLRRAALQRRGIGAGEVGFSFGDLVKAVAAPITAPAKAIVNIAKGKNVAETLVHSVTDPFAAALKVVSPEAARAIDKASQQLGVAANLATGLVQGALQAVTNNPIWDIAATGVSFIPGIGSAVSAGMATAAALGNGLSLQDAALLGAKNALPGGPVAAAALDVAVGVAQGRSLDKVALNAVRNQLPGGAIAQAVFDSGISVAKGGKVDAAALAKAGLSQVQITKLGTDLAKSAGLKGTLPGAKDIQKLVAKPLDKAAKAALVKAVTSRPKQAAKPVLTASVTSKPAAGGGKSLSPQQRIAKIASLTAIAKSEFQKTGQVSKETFYAFKDVAGEKAATQLLADLKKPVSSGGMSAAAKSVTDAAKKQAAAAVAKAKETAAKSGRPLEPQAVAQEALLLDKAASQLTKAKVTKKLATYVQEAVKQKAAEQIASSFASIPAAASYTTALATLEAAERGTATLNTAKADALKKQGKSQGDILKTLLGKEEGGASAAALATLVTLAAESKRGDKKAAMWLQLMNRAKADRKKMREAKGKLQKKLDALGSRAVVVMPDGRMMRGALSAIPGIKPVDPKKASKDLPVAIDHGKFYQLPKGAKLDNFKRV